MQLPAGMTFITGIDWEALFFPSTPLLEILIRGTLMYLGLYFLMRFVLKRGSAALSINDLLVIVLLADAAQNALADDYRSIPDGVLLVGTIVFWAHFLDWLGYRWPPFQRVVHPGPLQLVEDGRLIPENLGKELVTWEELMSELRLQGVDSLEQVDRAYMEGNGRISVITKSGTDDARGNPREGPELS